MALAYKENPQAIRGCAFRGRRDVKLGSTRMSQPAKAQEPSMEEILASIRRIIADDDPAKAAPAAVEPAPKPAPAVVAAPRPAPPPPRVAPVAVAASKQDEIDAVLAEIEPELPKPVPPKPAPAPVAAPAASDVLDLTEAMAATTFRKIDGASDIVFAERAAEAPEPPRPTPAPAPSAGLTENGLISAATRAAVDSAFNSLANTVLGNNARTLEDLVKEMLRPMLKSWLDDNLPGLVERIVRAEIERVSRGR
jgi:cell pole-organizing protein PopZ